MDSPRMTAVPHRARSQERQESKALVVAISVLQLSLVVVVWLLAIVPAALLALGALLFKSLRGVFRVAAPPSPLK
jgi:hypothetical protein